MIFEILALGIGTCEELTKHFTNMTDMLWNIQKYSPGICNFVLIVCIDENDVFDLTQDGI